MPDSSMRGGGGPPHRCQRDHCAVLAPAPAEIRRADGEAMTAPLISRIDTLDELEYFPNGGILSYLLRQLAA
jgi:aconitase A